MCWARVRDNTNGTPCTFKRFAGYVAAGKTRQNHERNHRVELVQIDPGRRFHATVTLHPSPPKRCFLKAQSEQSLASHKCRTSLPWSHRTIAITSDFCCPGNPDAAAPSCYSRRIPGTKEAIPLKYPLAANLVEESTDEARRFNYH